jgi:hypothetical protein
VVLSLALAALAAADAHGQEPEQAPPPARLVAPFGAAIPGAVACPHPPTAGPVPGCGPPACAPYEDHNGPLLWGDLRLDQPCFPGPGWIAAVEVGATLPTFRAPQLSFPVTVAGDTHDVAPPLARLAWTASPKVEVGYRLPAGAGELLAAYRNITSDGNATVAGFDPAGLARVRSRMNLNVIDLYYANHESSLGPGWDMRWDVGARLASFFFDTRAAGPSLQQRASMDSFTGGVKGGLALYRALGGVPGLSAGGRVEGAYLLGHIDQSFEEVQTPAGGPPVGGASRFPAGQGVAVGALQAGIRYTPDGPDGRLGFEAGYLYERWFSLGEAFANRGDLEVQSLFLRFTYNY